MKFSRVAGGALIALVYVFLLLPLVIVILASFNSSSYLAFPPAGFSLRWYGEFFRSSAFMDALWTSVVVGVVTAAGAVLLGAPAALFFVRFLRKRREEFRLALIAPMLLPEVLTAIALLFYFSQISFGTQTMVPLTIGHIVITVPYVFLTVSSALYNLPPSVEEAARTLGASPWIAFRRITLPLIKSGVVTGAILAFIMSFDNINISLLLKPVGSSTLPIQLFDYLRYDFDPTAAAAATVSVGITMLAVLVVDRLYGLRAIRF